MIIKELIEKLQKYDPTKPVWIYNQLGDVVEVKYTDEDYLVWKGSPCSTCAEGFYGEESINDDWEGKTTCSHCGHRRDSRSLLGVTLF